MPTVPIYVLAGQSNANLGGIDRAIEMFIANSGMAAELVKLAVNGTPLIADPLRTDWDPVSHELFDDLVTQILAAMAHVTAQGHTPDVHILWVQGEGYTDYLIEPYRDKLVEFVTTLRTAIGVPDAHVVINLFPRESTVRTAQLEAIAMLGDVETVDTYGLAGFWDSNAHYDRPTREMIASQFLALVPSPSLDDPNYVRTAQQGSVTMNEGTVFVTADPYTDLSYLADARPHNFIGFSGHDTLTGGNAADRFDGGDGDDVLRGLGGDDYIFGGTHDDALYGDAGRDILLGGNGFDRLFGGSGNDILSGARQDDALYGQGGDDTLKGGDGDDVMDGGIGLDAVSYLDADNGVTVSLMAIGPQNTGGQGVDTLRNIENLTGSLFTDILTGDTGANRLSGLDGDDRLSGLGGDDRIDGGAGRDVITGGAGRDSMSGGAGADRFIFGGGHFAGLTTATADVILDFSAADGDRIDLRPFDAVAGSIANDAFSFIGTAAFSSTAGELRYVVSGARVMVLGDINGDGIADFAIRLDSVAALTAADFFL